MLFDVIDVYVVLCNVLLRDVWFCDALLCDVLLSDVLLCDILLCDVLLLRDVLWCGALLPHYTLSVNQKSPSQLLLTRDFLTKTLQGFFPLKPPFTRDFLTKTSVY